MAGNKQSYRHTPILNVALSVVLLLLISFNSCTEKTLDDEKFIDTYVDLRIAEDTLKSDNYTMQDLKEKIFKKHGITEEQYNSAFEYLNKNPELWEKFYDKAIARVDTLKKTKK